MVINYDRYKSIQILNPIYTGQSISALSARHRRAASIRSFLRATSPSIGLLLLFIAVMIVLLSSLKFKEAKFNLTNLTKSILHTWAKFPQKRGQKIDRGPLFGVWLWGSFFISLQLQAQWFSFLSSSDFTYFTSLDQLFSPPFDTLKILTDPIYYAYQIVLKVRNSKKSKAPRQLIANFQP